MTNRVFQFKDFDPDEVYVLGPPTCPRCLPTLHRISNALPNHTVRALVLVDAMSPLRDELKAMGIKAAPVVAYKGRVLHGTPESVFNQLMELINVQA